MTQLGSEMDADRDIEPALGPEFVHIRTQFEGAVNYRYASSNDTAVNAFTNTSDLFTELELHYGRLLQFQIINTAGTPGNETVEYRMELMSTEQYLMQEGTLVLKR